jgi:hypothetical protein
MPVFIKGSGGGGGKTPTGTLNIVNNGTFDVSSYASAKVAVPVNTASGTKNITSNGTFDVSSYAYAKVDVPTQSDFSKLRTIPTELSSITGGGTVITLYWDTWINKLGLTAADIMQVRSLSALFTLNWGDGTFRAYQVLWDKDYGQTHSDWRRVDVKNNGITQSTGYISSVAFSDVGCTLYLESAVDYVPSTPAGATSSTDPEFGSAVVELY